MPLPSPLELLMDTIESNVQKDVKEYAPKCKEKNFSKKKSSKKKLYIFNKYNPKSIDRTICPLISLNGECDTYKDSLDEVTKNLLQEYAIKVQESEERIWFDENFDSDKYESKVNNIRKRRYAVAATTAAAVTAAGTFYLTGNIFDPRFYGQFPSSLIGGSLALLFESWFHPLGKIFMINYGKSRLLGTKAYLTDTKYYYTEKITKHLTKIRSDHPMLIYKDNLMNIGKN